MRGKMQEERTIFDTGLGLKPHLLDDIEHARNENESGDGGQTGLLSPDAATTDSSRHFGRLRVRLTLR